MRFPAPPYVILKIFALPGEYPDKLCENTPPNQGDAMSIVLLAALTVGQFGGEPRQSVVTFADGTQRTAILGTGGAPPKFVFFNPSVAPFALDGGRDEVDGAYNQRMPVADIVGFASLPSLATMLGAQGIYGPASFPPGGMTPAIGGPRRAKKASPLARHASTKFLGAGVVH